MAKVILKPEEIRSVRASPKSEKVRLSPDKIRGVINSDKEPSSIPVVIGKTAARSAVPAISGVAGAGAALTAGAPLIAASGPFAPVTAVTLAALGGVGAGSAGAGVQEKVLKSALGPEKYAAWEAQRAKDQEDRPYATLTGELIPGLAAFRPSIKNIKTAAGGVRNLIRKAPISSQQMNQIANVGGGAAMGAATEVAPRLVRGEPIDPMRTVAATAGGAVLNEPTKLGQKFGFKPSTPDVIAPAATGTKAVLKPGEYAPLPEATTPTATPSSMATEIQPTSLPSSDPTLSRKPVDLNAPPNELSTLPDLASQTTSSVGEGDLPKYAPVNLNLQRLDTPEAIKRSILDWQTQNKPQLEADYARFKKGNLLQRLKVENPEVDVDRLIQNNKYDLSSPEGQKRLLGDTYALRRINVGLQEQKARLRKAIELPNVTDSQKNQALAEMMALDAQQVAVSLAVQRRAQVAGQFLNSFKELANSALPAEKKVRVMEKIIRRRFGLNTEKYNQFLKGMEALQLENPDAAVNFLRDISTPTGKDLFWEYFYFNLLSGPATHEANLFGNALKLVSEGAFVKPIVAGAEAARNVIRREPVTPAMKSLQGYYAGLQHGFGKGINRALTILRNGFDPEELVNPDKWSSFRFEAFASHPNPNVRRLSPIINSFGRALKASDAIFRTSLEQAEFYSRVNRIASKSGKSVDEVLGMVKAGDLPGVLTKSRDYAAYGTFNQEPGRFTQEWLQLAKRVPQIRFLTPFMRISANIAKQGFLDYSPAGFRALIRRGDMDGIQAAEALVRAGLGTGVLTYGALLFAQGRLTLEAPPDAANKDQFYRSGKQPFSLKIGDTWIPIRRFEPFSTPFIVGAILANVAQQGEEDNKDLLSIIAASGTEIGRMMVNTSYLSGIQNFFSVFERQGNDPASKAEKFTSGAASTMIPASSLLRTIANATDPVLRDPKGFLQKLKAQIPGLSKEVPARLDVFGNTKEKPGGSIGAVSFVKPTKETSDALTKELETTGVRIGFPQRTVNGEKLNDEQYRDYLEESGQAIRTVMERIIKMPGYQKLSLKQRKVVLDKVVDDVSSKVRKAVRQKRFPKPSAN